MMTQNADKKREQIQMFCMDDMVPQDQQVISSFPAKSLLENK